MNISRRDSFERKVFGGANFIIVLWALLSMFHLASTLGGNPLYFLLDSDLYVFIVPLVFLCVLNIFMGITLFFPQDKNKMWVMSMLIVTVTLVALNTFQLRIDNELRAQQEALSKAKF